MATHIIDAAIEVTAEEVNNYLLAPSTNGIVIPGNLLAANGNVDVNLGGKVALSLVNIEEDRLSRPLDLYRKQANGTVDVIQPEIRLNLYLLFVAVPMTNGIGDPFIASLGNLSKVVAFFQTRNYFNRQNTPSLDARIEKMVFEMYSLTMEQQNHLWGSLGAKYLPSVLYKVRLVRIQEEEVAFDGPPIQNINISGQGKEL